MVSMLNFLFMQLLPSFHFQGARSKVIYELNGQEEIILFRYKRNYPHKLKVSIWHQLTSDEKSWQLH